MEIAIVCRHGANKKKFVEATVGAAGKFGTENDLRSQLLTGAVQSPRPLVIEAAKYLMLLALPAVASPCGPFKKCRELHWGPSGCADRVARVVARRAVL